MPSLTLGNKVDYAIKLVDVYKARHVQQHANNKGRNIRFFVELELKPQLNNVIKRQENLEK